MTRAYCDVCGTEIDVDSVPKPTHYSLSLTHYNPMSAWDSGLHWTHLCLACAAAASVTLEAFAASRQGVVA